MYVISTVVINGKSVTLSYINTYYEKKDAIREAKLLSGADGIWSVSVHHWILKEDGTEEIVNTGNIKDDVPYWHTN